MVDRSKKVYSYIKPYLWVFLVAVLAMIVESSTSSAIAFLVKPALDKVILVKNFSMLKLIPIALVSIYLVKGVFGYLSSYLMGVVGFSIVTDFRNKMFEKCQGLPISYFTGSSSGEIVSRFLYDVNILSRAFSKVLTKFFRNIFTVVFLCLVLFYRNWKLAFISVFLLPLFYYFFSKFGRKMKRKSLKSQEVMGRLTSVLTEAIRGMRVIRAFCAEDKEVRRFKEENLRVLRIAKRIFHTDALTAPVMEFIGGIGVGAIIFYGGYMVMNGSMTAGTFFSFMTALGMLYKPVRSVSKANNNLQRAFAAMDRVEEFLNIEEDVKEPKSPIVIDGFKKEIVFDRVCFSYQEGRPVLRDVSFSVEKGEVVAILGKSGSGKTTLLNLLLRFYDPSSGVISIDGVNIKSISLKSLRSLMGLVTQEPFLFNDTVLNNILYGRENATFEEVVEAAKMAHAHEFIEKLPDGYHTLVGEMGAKLSGGERQRIALARAILRDPPILLLDEPTSNLDVQSEELVIDTISRLMESKTVLVVTHRLSLAKRADKVLLMEDGRVVEMGTHKDLMETEDSLYRKFHELQIH